LAVTGNLTLANTTTLNPVAGGVLPAGVYPLLTYTGSLTGSTANLAFDPAFVATDYRSTFSFNDPGGSLNLVVTGAPIAVTWSGAITPDWDINTTANWTGGEKFFSGDSVTFDDTAVSGAAPFASLTTNLTGDFNDLVFTAKTAGPGGEAISIRYVLPTDPDQPLSISVTGSAITVNLATDANGLVDTTAGQIQTAIAASSEANALVAVANAAGDDGTGYVTAMAAVYLDLGVTETVAIATGITVAPGSLTFANSALDYVLNGPGSMGGNTGLLKSGKGKLTINTTNSFTGGTVIAKGEVVANAANALGTGSITFGDATTTATDSCTLALGTGLALANPTITVADTCLSTRISTTGGTIANTAITKKGTGLLTIGHATDYTQSTAYLSGTSSLLIEKGRVAFSSRTAFPTGVPITLGNANSDADPTILEVPRASAADQLVLNAAVTLGTVDPGDTSEAIIRYTGLSAGSTTTNGAPSFQGTVNLNGRDLYIENVSNTTGGTVRLANFQAVISGTGNIHMRNGTLASGLYDGNPRFRLNPTAANTWTGDLYIDTGMTQIGNGSITTAYNAIPDTAVVYMAAGTRMGFGSSGDTFRGLVGGAPTTEVPFPSVVDDNTGGGGTITLTLNGAGDYVYDGNFNASASRTININKTGTGTQTFNGTRNGLGSITAGAGTLVLNGSRTGDATASTTTTTTVTAGTLAVGKDDALGIGTVNLNNAAGTIRAANANARTLANPITYSTDFTLGSPTTGNLTFTGPVNVGGLPKVFNVQNAVTEFSGAISGSATPNRTKTGPGTLVFSGNNTYPGFTLVNEGTLLVNNLAGSGTGTSTVTVAAGATLGGTGSISGAVTTSAGTAKVAPGASIGVLTVGSLDLSAGGTLAIEVDDTAMPKNDKLVVTGNLNLSGATLSVLPTGALTQPAYVIASYGTLTGTFGTANVPAGYELRYNYYDGVSSNNIALVSDPYLTWLNDYPSMTGANRAPDVDFDNDGLDNGIEFVIGSDPTAGTFSGRPSALLNGGYLQFSFKRTDASEGFDVYVESGTDLQTWPGQQLVPVAEVTGPPVTVADNGAAPADVTVFIPMGTDPTKFGRLKVAIPFTP
jgi:autotransporter-associated beta strand protein